uniref:Uncharacterized protein n=1 Tax=Anguilla anguilla TaxID=7936 RepID=A0A0E9V1I2_ANGAN
MWVELHKDLLSHSQHRLSPSLHIVTRALAIQHCVPSVQP